MRGTISNVLRINCIDSNNEKRVCISSSGPYTSKIQNLEVQRHYISFNFIVICSVELRELEAKLKAGYMNKERAAQLAEKEVIRKQEEVCFYLQHEC